MNLTSKGDLVLSALRRLGIASNATLTDVEPQSMEDGVNDLEMMMAEWMDEDGVIPGINTGYLFAPADIQPDAGDPHGVVSSKLSAIIHNLACRIAPDYGIDANQKLVMLARYGKEQLIKSAAVTRSKRASYPSRMPVGSGNRLNIGMEWRFFPGEGEKKEGD